MSWFLVVYSVPKLSFSTKESDIDIVYIQINK